MNRTNEWIDLRVALPQDGELVETKIMDSNGERNHQDLKRNGRLWFVSDGKTYVYYTPTHWRKKSNQ